MKDLSDQLSAWSIHFGQIVSLLWLRNLRLQTGDAKSKIGRTSDVKRVNMKFTEWQTVDFRKLVAILQP